MFGNQLIPIDPETHIFTYIFNTNVELKKLFMMYEYRIDTYVYVPSGPFDFL